MAFRAIHGIEWRAALQDFSDIRPPLLELFRGDFQDHIVHQSIGGYFF
jgi:hypothetical protein